MVLTGLRERFGLFEHEKKVMNKLNINTNGNIECFMVNFDFTFNLKILFCFLPKINK